MKQILLFAVIGAVIVGATSAFAAGNVISFSGVQSLGASADQALTTDLNEADVNFDICQTGTNLAPGIAQCVNGNIAGITACEISDPLTDKIPIGGTIYCKLTGPFDPTQAANGKGTVVAEGVYVNNGNAPVQCPCVAGGTQGPLVAPIANGDFDVQQVHDVKIVYKGPAVP